MRRLCILLALLALILVAALIFALVPSHTRVINAGQHSSDAASVERGRYLAVAGDCTACHTSPAGNAFAGGLPLASPLGTIYSTNITPDRESGIGTYSLDDFDRAVRHGIDKQGETLYPAMPYPSYARLTDADLAALYDYFMNGVQAARSPEYANAIPWPLSMRWPLAIWRKLFAPAADAAPFDAAGYKDPMLARGAYLVQGLGHCGSCHTPRAVTLQETALDESSNQFLAGGQVIGGWVAVNLRGNNADGLGRWSKDDIVSTLKSARNAEHAVIGSEMNDVVVHSTQYLTPADREAIAAYLKTLGPEPDDQAKFVTVSSTAADLAAGREANRGAELYDDNCAACHRSDGAGSRNALPSIAGNPSVLSADASSLIRLVLVGSSLPGTISAPSPLGMPGFGARLSNAEVSQLITFIRSGWGNSASPVSAGEVARIRAAL
jgi:alcohol dehydrogenase (quinone), cytochrome c subunit